MPPAVSPAEVDRLAMALARLLASSWRRDPLPFTGNRPEYAAAWRCEIVAITVHWLQSETEKTVQPRKRCSGGSPGVLVLAAQELTPAIGRVTPPMQACPQGRRDRVDVQGSRGEQSE